MKPNVFFIIPARGGSKRLPRKNLHLLFKKPLIQYAIEACKRSEYFNGDNIFVTTEDSEIANFSSTLGANIIKRPDALAADNVWTQEVLKHAVTQIESIEVDNKHHLIVRVQANSPQVDGDKIDECIEKLINHDLWEVFTIDEQLIEDAAIHVMRAKCVYQAALSVYKGVVQTDYVDVHDRYDLAEAARRMR